MVGHNHLLLMYLSNYLSQESRKKISIEKLAQIFSLLLGSITKTQCNFHEQSLVIPHDLDG